jgi:EAL domain-containing protein (putative c-di-GMP-specific phosphodiesterase class I)
MQERNDSRDSMLQALQAGQFCATYQPQIALDNGVLTALVVRGRWNHPERGMLEQAQLMADLTVHGMVGPYLQAITQQAAAQLTSWQQTDAAMAGLKLKLFLAAELVADLAALGRLLTCLQEQGIANGSVLWQVSEAVVAAGEPLLLHNLSRLNLRGFAIGAVDCGRYHATAQQFACCPLTELTLDRQFARADERNKRLPQLEQLIAGARQMDIVVHADEISSRADWAALRQAGCSHGQGPLIGPPMVAEDFLRWLGERQMRLPLPMADIDN